MSDEKNNVNRLLHETKENCASLTDQLQNKIEVRKVCLEQIEKDILETTAQTHRNIDIAKEVLMKAIHSKKVDDDIEAAKIQQSVFQIRKRLESFRKNYDDANDTLSDWRELKESRESAQDFFRSIERELRGNKD